MTSEGHHEFAVKALLLHWLAAFPKTAVIKVLHKNNTHMWDLLQIKHIINS